LTCPLWGVLSFWIVDLSPFGVDYWRQILKIASFKQTPIIIFMVFPRIRKDTFGEIFKFLDS